MLLADGQATRSESYHLFQGLGCQPSCRGHFKPFRGILSYLNTSLNIQYCQLAAEGIPVFTLVLSVSSQELSLGPGFVLLSRKLRLQPVEVGTSLPMTLE